MGRAAEAHADGQQRLHHVERPDAPALHQRPEHEQAQVDHQQAQAEQLDGARGDRLAPDHGAAGIGGDHRQAQDQRVGHQGHGPAGQVPAAVVAEGARRCAQGHQQAPESTASPVTTSRAVSRGQGGQGEGPGWKCRRRTQATASPGPVRQVSAAPPPAGETIPRTTVVSQTKLNHQQRRQAVDVGADPVAPAAGPVGERGQQQGIGEPEAEPGRRREHAAFAEGAQQEGPGQHQQGAAEQGHHVGHGHAGGRRRGDGGRRRDRDGSRRVREHGCGRGRRGTAFQRRHPLLEGPHRLGEVGEDLVQAGLPGPRDHAAASCSPASPPAGDRGRYRLMKAMMKKGRMKITRAAATPSRVPSSGT